MRALRLRLVDDCGAVWRWWSARMMAVALVLQVIPAETFLTVYALVPGDLQMLLPSRTALVIAATVLAFIARVWKQKPPKKKRRKGRAATYT